jgi:hypothetical protein
VDIQYINGEFRAEVNGNVIVSKNKDYLKRKIAALQESLPAKPKAVEQFEINDRFMFTEQLVSMVAKGETQSCVITGEGGLGKTYTVIKALKAAGMTDISEFDVGDVVPPRTSYRVVKGFSTAKGLYKVLYENKNSILVFDDCDSILKDPDALNILKGALDSYDKRLITWNTSINDDGLPRFFEFKGGIIFVSNRDPEKIDQAIRSRSMNVDLAMSTDQKLERMEHIMASNEFLPNISLGMKQDALTVIRENKDIATEISLRTLINVSKIRNSGNTNWYQLAKYMLVN